MALPVDTERLISQAIYATLSTALTTAGYGSAGPFYQLAPQGSSAPYVVFQYQTIDADDRVGNRSGVAQVAIKGIATNPSAAATIAAVAAAAMSNLALSGYRVGAYYLSSPVVPSDGTLWQSVHLFDVRIEEE